MNTQMFTITAVLGIIYLFENAASQSSDLSNQCTNPDGFNNGLWSESNNPRIVHFECHRGFLLQGPPKQVCTNNGTWDPPDIPVCVKSGTMCEKPFLINGDIKMVRSEYAPGDMITIVCSEHYAMRVDETIAQKLNLYCSQDGRWVTTNGWRVNPECSVKLCSSPPEVPNSRMGEYSALPSPITAFGEFMDGQEVMYKCDPGYTLMDPKTNKLICKNGEWLGSLPSCGVSTLNKMKLCSSPPDVPNSRMGEYPAIPSPITAFGEFMDGQEVMYKCDTGYTLMDPKTRKLICKNGEWLGSLPSCVKSCPRPEKIAHGVVSYPDQLGDMDDFRLGFVVRYKCNLGYKLMGYSSLVCTDGPMWSHHPPQCILDQESGMYCKSISQITNGRCFCETKSDLEYCEPFYRGLHVECVCDSGYKMVGQGVMTCRQTGQWDYDMPSCVPALEIDSKGDVAVDSQSHMSTLAIVVATACSVLGVLLLIMVIMVFRRRKPHPPRLCRPSSTPPPYSRVHSNSLDEHDRALLIGYENNHIALPSYEEATSAGQQHGGHFVPRSGQVGEYRPLPSIPSGLRSVQSLSGDSSNRHSIITSSTMNRDGISEVFGSIDTVNVSMSDASTAVTIETLDSASSHHSNMSRRATAGSINSSNGSLVTEDVPLLENNERNEQLSSDSSEEEVQNKPED